MNSKGQIHPESPREDVQDGRAGGWSAQGRPPGQLRGPPAAILWGPPPQMEGGCGHDSCRCNSRLGRAINTNNSPLVLRKQLKHDPAWRPHSMESLWSHGQDEVAGRGPSARKRPLLSHCHAATCIRTSEMKSSHGGCQERCSEMNDGLTAFPDSSVLPGLEPATGKVLWEKGSRPSNRDAQTLGRQDAHASQAPRRLRPDLRWTFTCFLPSSQA